jgi:hypothetical protein
MFKGKKITKRRHRRKPQTRKRSRHNMSKSRYGGGLRLNIDEKTGWIDKSQEKILLDMKDIIDIFITGEKAKPPEPQSKDYLDNIALFDEYEKTIQHKKENFSEYDYTTLSSLLGIIVQTKMSFYDGIALLQKLLTSIYLHFVNDVEINDTTEVKLRKRITNNTPYVDVSHKRSGYEPVYDINELFALVRKEVEGSEQYNKAIKDSTLKKININTNLGLETGP